MTAVPIPGPSPVRVLAMYFFRTTDGRFYRLVLINTKFYLCDRFTNYVGTGRLVIVKGTLLSGFVLFAREIRDPAYQHSCTLYW